MATPFLQVSGIGKQDRDGPVLRDISFLQSSLQKIAIAGETGSGKSTLLKVIAGLAQPDTGEIRFEGNRVKGPAEKLIPGHPGIAYLSQQYELPQNLKVEQVLEYANNLSEREAEELYGICRIDHLRGRKTSQLSGGERQRIALARLLVGSPRLLLLDEPFSNLDRIHKDILKSVIRDIGGKTQITCLLVSHDPLDLLSWAEEILVIRKGEIVQRGAPPQIYNQPVDEYTASLFGAYNLVTSEPDGKTLFLRPENLRLTKEKGPDDRALKGIVNELNYFGGFFEIGIVLLDQGGQDFPLHKTTVGRTPLLVRAVTCDLSKGEVVYLSLPKTKAWYL